MKTDGDGYFVAAAFMITVGAFDASAQRMNNMDDGWALDQSGDQLGKARAWTRLR